MGGFGWLWVVMGYNYWVVMGGFEWLRVAMGDDGWLLVGSGWLQVVTGGKCGYGWL